MLRKNKFILVFLLFVFSMILFISSIFIRSKIILDSEEFYVSLNVSNISGIDLNKTALTFGNIMPGSTSTRNLIIENNYNFPVTAEINIKGEIKRFLIFERRVYLKENEIKKVGVTAIVAENERYADYDGKIIVVIKKDI